jgi:hypothetical protein
MTRSIALIFLLAACSDSREVLDELPNSSLAGAPRADVSESRMDAPVARAVTIGEDGPRLDACGGMGQVLRTGAGGQPLRAAPFGDAKVLATLNEGDRAYICTRSLDQKCGRRAGTAACRRQWRAGPRLRRFLPRRSQTAL